MDMSVRYRVISIVGIAFLTAISITNDNLYHHSSISMLCSIGIITHVLFILYCGENAEKEKRTNAPVKGEQEAAGASGSKTPSE